MYLHVVVLLLSLLPIEAKVFCCYFYCIRPGTKLPEWCLGYVNTRDPLAGNTSLILLSFKHHVYCLFQSQHTSLYGLGYNMSLSSDFSVFILASRRASVLCELCIALSILFFQSGVSLGKLSRVHRISAALQHRPPLAGLISQILFRFAS